MDFSHRFSFVFVSPPKPYRKMNILENIGKVLKLYINTPYTLLTKFMAFLVD